MAQANQKENSMTFSLHLIGGFNPFEWDDLFCPICKGKDFTSMSHAGVHCDNCNALFVVRDTTGDPGLVIDCHAENVRAPVWRCSNEDCYGNMASFEPAICPLNLNHGTMERYSGITTKWNAKPEERHRMLILKVGDYCSGWTRAGNGECNPTQTQWDAYQEKMQIKGESHDIL